MASRRRVTKHTKKKSKTIESINCCDYCGKLFPVIRDGIFNPETGQLMRYTYGRLDFSAFEARNRGLSVLIPGDRCNSRPTGKVMIFCNNECMEAAK